MSIVAGIMDGTDIVIASDGCSGSPCSDHYVLKTARLNEEVCVGMTGHTDFMKLILPEIGLAVPSWVRDEELFWYIEQAPIRSEMRFLEAWDRLQCTFDRLRESLRASKDAVAVVLVGKGSGGTLHDQWDRKGNWARHEHPNSIIRSCDAMFRIGRPAANQEELSGLSGILDQTRGTCAAEERLTRGIRYWSECDGGQTVNKNVFIRRMSKKFALEYSLAPRVHHAWAIPHIRASRRIDHGQSVVCAKGGCFFPGLLVVAHDGVLSVSEGEPLDGFRTFVVRDGEHSYVVRWANPYGMVIVNDFGVEAGLSSITINSEELYDLASVLGSFAVCSLVDPGNGCRELLDDPTGSVQVTYYDARLA